MGRDFLPKHFACGAIFGLSTNWSLETLGVTSVRSSVRTFVRSYVRTSVTRFLGNRSLLFSETLQLVRAFRCEKNVPSVFFDNFHRFCHFGQKLSKVDFLAKNDQNGGF